MLCQLLPVEWSWLWLVICTEHYCFIVRAMHWELMGWLIKLIKAIGWLWSMRGIVKSQWNQWIFDDIMVCYCQMWTIFVEVHIAEKGGPILVGRRLCQGQSWNKIKWRLNIIGWKKLLIVSKSLQLAHGNDAKYGPRWRLRCVSLLH